MGRKEGGSLFHQMINAPGVFVRNDRKGKDGNPIPVSYKSREDYYDWLHRAADFFKSQGIKKLKDIGISEIQNYELHLEQEGKTASTIHSYLAPVCKAAGIEMNEINKPMRHGSEFTRSSGKGAKGGGRPAKLNKMLGVRENELRNLRGNDTVERNGVLYVIIRKGKGGKYHEQKVLPQYEKEVKSFFDGSTKKVFRADEFNENFDYHGQRRSLAKEAYVYYEGRIAKDPGYRKELYREIAGQWHANNRKHRDKLEPASHFDKPYKLRGKNRELAVKQGKPTELDRLVLRAVSVQHLAHWRDGVTIQSYFFDRGNAE